jgi:ATPase subunit of ABC transporter with duplicated ATPase domains
VLRLVQEAVQKGSSGAGLKEPATQMLVEPGAALGRRKLQSGKEPGVSVQVSNGPPAGGAATVAFSEREAMALLNRFQFPPRRWQDRVSRLSGGERRRLQLLQVLARAPNVLLLDEPSNDLGTRDFITCILAFLMQPFCADPDLGTLTALEEYLCEEFQGCLVLVSHDNFFVNRVAEHLFVFEGDGVVRDFLGSYDDYLEYRKEARLS